MIQMQLNLERRRKRNERKRERWIIKIEKTSCRDVSDSQLSRRLFRDQFHTYHEQGTFHWWFPLSRELDQRLWFNNARETDEKTRSRSFRTVRTSAGHGALLCALLCSTMFNVRTRPAFLPFPIIPFLLWPHSHAPFFCFFLQRQFLIQA